MQSPPSSVALSIGSYDLHYYGIIMFAAIAAALFVIRAVAKKYYKDVSTDIIVDILPVIILCSILGARLYYVIMDFSYFSRHLNEIFAVWNGGMSIHGGILGGIISGLVMAKIKHIKFLKYADVFVYGIAIGQAIGRFGNWFNCEAFGRPCEIPFIKLFIPYAYRPAGFEQIEYFHPAFLYESIWDICVFLILFFVVRRIVLAKKLGDGTIFFSYLLLYSFGRIFVEWCRIDSVKSFWGVPVAQIASIFIIIASLAALFIINKRKGKI